MKPENFDISYYIYFRKNNHVTLFFDTLVSIVDSLNYRELLYVYFALQPVIEFYPIVYSQVKNGSKRFANFVRSKIIRRKEKETVVQDINIVQEDNETWARRSVGSAASRTSIDSKLSSGSDKTKDVNILTNLDDGELEE